MKLNLDRLRLPADIRSRTRKRLGHIVRHQEGILVLGEGADARAVRRLAGIRGGDPRWRVRPVADLVAVGMGTTQGTVAVGAGSLADLRAMLPVASRCGRALRVMVLVQETERTDQFVIPATLTATRLVRGDIKVRRRGRGGVVVTLDFSAPTSVGKALRSVVSGPRAGGSVPAAAGLRLGVSSMEASAWAAGDPWARVLSSKALVLAPGDIAPIDVVVGGEVEGIEHRPGGLPLVKPGPDLLPPVDTRVISPRGFDNQASQSAGRLVVSEGQNTAQVLDPSSELLFPLDLRAGFTEVGIRQLRPLRHLDLETTLPWDPVTLARLLSQLLVAGVPVRTGTLPARVRGLLGADLADRLEAFDEETSRSALDREAWSVGARRSALLRFASPIWWRDTAATLGITASPDKSVSVLIASIRPANLGFALTQLERQTWPHLEVVLALHGIDPDDPDVRAAVKGFTRPLQVVTVEAGVVFGDVLNAALDRASGRLVAKMDDDDWYGPDHVTDLVLTHGYSGATMVGCADHFTYLEASAVTIRDQVHRSEQWSSRVSGGTLALARDDLLALGRWRPVHRAVDRCLIQAVGATGGLLYGMHDLGFCLYRGAGGHTWAQGDEVFLARRPEQWPGRALPPHIGDPVPR